MLPVPSKRPGTQKLFCKHLPFGWLIFPSIKQQLLAKSNRWRKSPLSLPEKSISPGPLLLARKNQSYNKHWIFSFRLCLLRWKSAMKNGSVRVRLLLPKFPFQCETSVHYRFPSGFLGNIYFFFHANNLPDTHALVLGCVSLGQFSQMRINWLHKTAETLAQASAKKLSPHRSVTCGAIQLCPCNEL